MPKTWYKVVIALVSVIVASTFIFFFALALSEYFPEDTEDVSIEGKSTKTLKLEKNISIITYDLGYLSLDNTQDYFMDGGKNVRPDNATNVTKNLAAVKSFIENQGLNIYLFQNVDVDAKRSYSINQYEGLKEDFEGTACFANTYKSLYIPYPVFNAVGHVESGLMTLNKYKVTKATRISLPSAYGWPKRAVMFKNCLLEQRLEIEDSDKELVIYNVELDKYGDVEVRQEQLDVLLNLMRKEYQNGNYVIAGGNFNQTFPNVDLEKFPIEVNKDYNPVQIEKDYLSKEWKFVTDPAKPTCRALDQAYKGSYENAKLYIVDGFIISPNVEKKDVETLENNFSYSNHQPVKMKFRLI